MDSSRTWVPSVASYRQEVEQICQNAGSCCPGCGLQPKHRPTGYIKHLQICKALSTPELMQLAACSWYVCRRKGDNASSRPQRPSLADFKAQALGPVLRAVDEETLDDLWQLCEGWRVPDEIPVPSYTPHPDDLLSTESEVLSVKATVLEHASTRTSAERQDIARSARTLLPFLNATVPPHVKVSYSGWRDVLEALSDVPVTPIPSLVPALFPWLLASPTAANCPSTLPTARQYLSQLPGGLDSIDLASYKSVGVMFQQSQGVFVATDALDIPPEYKTLLVAAFSPTEFYPESYFMLLLCLVRDLHCGGDNERYLSFCYNLIYGSVNQILGSPPSIESYDEALDLAPILWQHFKRGTTLNVIERGPDGGTLSLAFPEGLYVDCLLQGFQQSIRAFMDHQDIPASVALKIKSHTHATFELRWLSQKFM